MERRTQPGYEYHSCDFMDEGVYIDMNLLRDYEDTGLTPQEIMGKVEALKIYQEEGLTPDQIRELKERDTAKTLVQFGDEDEPMLRCPHCDENVTDLMECGFNFCPYCGGRWED